MANQYYDRLDELRATWNHRDSTQLKPPEHFWTDHQKWLESRGYMLRPRFRPDWVPSWRGTNKFYFSCEDGRSNYVRACYISLLALLTLCQALPLNRCYAY